jgi:hypothetical protein
MAFSSLPKKRDHSAVFSLLILSLLKVEFYKKGERIRKAIPPTNMATAKFATDIIIAVFQP